MPPKKKKGKGSKFARMSEEERLRYMQHRAELELEAKRRKQELIAVFTKSKLKREEAFARLNTAKINEQWRFLLRQIKRKEFYGDVDYLWRNFERTLKAKDAVVHKLYEELELVDLNNRRLQESHIEMLDKLIERHRERLKSMQSSYNLAIREKETGEIEELNILHSVVANDRKYLDTVIYAQSQCTESILTMTRTRNAVSTRGFEYAKEDEISLMTQRVGGQIENLWKQLNDVISEYESSSVNKRKQYKYLKEQDNSIRSDAAQFPRLQSNFQCNLEILRENYHKLMNARYGRIDDLKIQAKRSNDSIYKSRKEIRIHQMMDGVQLKRTSVMSLSVIQKLKRIEERGAGLLLLMRMCSKLEPTALVVKKYAIHCAEMFVETNEPCVTTPYDKMDKFWEQCNYVKAINIHKKCERDQLMLENNRLRHTLRNYLITLSRLPASMPQNSN